MSASQPPASEQAAMAAKYSSSRNPTSEEILREVNAWKSLSVTAIAAENSNVAEYIAQLEAEAKALLARCQDAEAVILRGVELLGERTGEWAGVRGWLEQDESHYSDGMTAEDDKRFNRQWDVDAAMQGKEARRG